MSAAAAYALDAADGRIDGGFFGAPIVAAAPAYGATSFAAPAFGTTSYAGTAAYGTTTFGAPSYMPAMPPAYLPAASSALALDAADGVIDGKFFGSRVMQTGGYSTALAAPAPAITYGAGTVALAAPAIGAGYGAAYGAGFGASSVVGSSYEIGPSQVVDDVIVGEEVIEVPVRVPIRIRRQVEQIMTQAPALVAPPQIQFVEKVVQGASDIREVEKIVRVYVCNGCGKDIEGEHLEMPNGRFHRECYVDCAACGRWIQFDAYEGLGQMWHREHFLCGVCGKSCADGWVLHNGRAAHQACIVVKKTSVTRNPGMAAKREIKAKTFEEAVRYDEMGGGAPDGKYNGISIVCEDPRWQARCKERGYDLEATWECSDATVAQRYKSGTGKTVVSTDGQVDGNV